MNIKNLFLIGMGTLAIATLVGAAVGREGFWAVVILLTVVVGGALVDKFVWVRIPEMEVGIAYNVEAQAFTRFLPPGRHLLLFPVERVKDYISTAPGTTRGQVVETQTGDGVAVTLEWTLLYVLNPLRIETDLQPRLALSLPKFAGKLIGSHVNNCVQEFVSETQARNLHDNGARGRLERILRQRVAERVAPFGVEVFRIIVTAVAFPSHVQATIEDVYREQLQAQSQAQVMVRLQEAVNKFSDRDMDILMQLAQLRVLGENGVLLQLPYAHLMDMVNMRPPNRAARHHEDGVKRPPAASLGDDLLDEPGVWPHAH